MATGRSKTCSRHFAFYPHLLVLAFSKLLPPIFLATALLGVLVALHFYIRSGPFTWRQSLYYVLAIFLVRLLWKASVPHRLPIPRDQGVVVICNHRSSVDPFFLQVTVRAPMHWMVAKEYVDHPALGWFLKPCDVIPVNRGGVDTTAMRIAIRYAESGQVVGMFPEGRINRSSHFMQSGRPGAVVAALKARVPILPCYIEGSPDCKTTWGPFFMGARVKLHIGPLLDLSHYYGLTSDRVVVGEILLACMQQIAELAGEPDFQPELAGRRWKPSV